MPAGLGPGCVNAVFAVVGVGAFDGDMFSVLLGGMFVQDAVMGEETFLLGGGEVLVSEEDNASLGDEEGELVELSRVELGKLNS